MKKKLKVEVIPFKEKYKLTVIFDTDDYSKLKSLLDEHYPNCKIVNWKLCFVSFIEVLA